MATQTQVVKLTSFSNSKKDYKPKTREFSIAQANALLKTKKTAWKLSDPGYEWNGTEIAKKSK